jgi:hypothetical protein
MLLASQPDLGFSLDLHQNQLGPGALTQVTRLQPFPFHLFLLGKASRTSNKSSFLVERKRNSLKLRRWFTSIRGCNYLTYLFSIDAEEWTCLSPEVCRPPALDLRLDHFKVSTRRISVRKRSSVHGFPFEASRPGKGPCQPWSVRSTLKSRP